MSRPTMKPMPVARPVCSFVVRACQGCRVQVVVLPTTVDVDRQYNNGPSRRSGVLRVACFDRRSSKGCIGTIVFGLDGDFARDVPREATHAAIRYFATSRGPIDEEELATIVGNLASRIAGGLRRRGCMSHADWGDKPFYTGEAPARRAT